MNKPKRSEVVAALADIASRGKYEVSPIGARQMNEVFEHVAKLINELEAEEKAAEEVSNDS
jgi:ATP-dependent protease HslVU (ClpYQ) ATPase subunit